MQKDPCPDKKNIRTVFLSGLNRKRKSRTNEKLFYTIPNKWYEEEKPHNSILFQVKATHLIVSQISRIYYEIRHDA